MCFARMGGMREKNSSNQTCKHTEYEDAEGGLVGVSIAVRGDSAIVTTVFPLRRGNSGVAGEGGIVGGMF